MVRLTLSIREPFVNDLNHKGQESEGISSATKYVRCFQISISELSLSKIRIRGAGIRNWQSITLPIVEEPADCQLLYTKFRRKKNRISRSHEVMFKIMKNRAYTGSKVSRNVAFLKANP